MKFKILNKGRITQGYNENANGAYHDAGLSGHPGVDWTRGYGSLMQSDNGGYCYKHYLPGERQDNWTAIYLLVPDGDDFVEVCYGHMSRVFIRTGMEVLEGQFIGKEGNFGLVFQGGLQITPQMQNAGDRRGSHVHEQYRPVKRVKKMLNKKFYLETRTGEKYRDAEGLYYEIKNTNNVKGCIDPQLFVYKDTVSDKIRCITNSLLTINQLQ
jgi:hypothetical protein